MDEIERGEHLGITWSIRHSHFQAAYGYILLTEIDQTICQKYHIIHSHEYPDRMIIDCNINYPSNKTRQRLISAIEDIVQLYNVGSEKYLESEKQFSELLK